MTYAAMHNEIMTALQWYADQGVHEIVLDEPMDYTAQQIEVAQTPLSQSLQQVVSVARSSDPSMQSNAASMFLGKSDAYQEALRLAKKAKNLDELREAIAGFDGIAIKKTASNLVFADGNPQARIMLIGDAPDADEDKTGFPFAGASGQLLDKILAAIGLNRHAEEPKAAVYLSNILNWRPPGNRTPSSAEIEVSLPFIERHIQLIQPEILILCGAGAAKALLAVDGGLSRLRKTDHMYNTLSKDIGQNIHIPAFPIYHPSDLLNTPIYKKSVWEDVLKIKKKIHES